MTLKDALKRIEELEQRIRALEARLVYYPVYYHVPYLPAQPYYTPPTWPYYNPAPPYLTTWGGTTDATC